MKKVTLGTTRIEGSSIRFLNPERKPLTPEKLRELSGLNLPDVKADEIIDSIRLLCSVLYQFSNGQKKRYIDGQTVNSLDSNIQNLAA